MWYPEALVLSLEQEDTVIRRLRQKMEFLAEDLVSTDEPTDAALTGYLAQYPELFHIGSKYVSPMCFLMPIAGVTMLTGMRNAFASN